MKRLLIILCLLFAAPALAEEPLQLAGMLQGVVAGSGTAACTPAYSTTELYTSANAIADTNGEVNAITGWTNNGLETLESTSSGSPHSGNYHLHLLPNSSGDWAYSVLPGSNGNIYKCTLWAKHDGVGGNFYFTLGYNYNYRYINLFTLTPSHSTYSQFSFWYYRTDQCDYMILSDTYNSSNWAHVYMDDMSCRQQTTTCFSSNLFTNSNAASLVNEANSLGDWVDPTSTASIVTDSADGTYSIKVTADGINNARVYFDLNSILKNGTKYFITAKVKREAGDIAIFCISTANTVTQYLSSACFPATTSWQQEGYFCKYDGSNCRYIGVSEYGTNNNAIIYLDSVAIYEVLND